jgi:SAM-dependent methyltransferase
MERLDKQLFNDPILAHEHFSRYLFVFDLIHGNVCDCACGIGYGTSIISKNTKTKSLLGVDIDVEAVAFANQHYSNKKLSFMVSPIEEITLSEKADFFLCFETLEHLAEPLEAINNIHKNVSPEGILIGSVPTKNYENLCESAFGKNEYHLQRFDEKDLGQLLQFKFKYFKILKSEMYMASVVSEGKYNESIKINDGSRVRSNRSPHGSYLFFATNSLASMKLIETEVKGECYFGPSYIETNTFFKQPLLNTIHEVETLVNDRDAYIKELEQKTDEAIGDVNKSAVEINVYIKQLEQQTVATIKDIEKLVVERDVYIKQLEQQTVATIKDIEKLVVERDVYIKELEQKVNSFMDSKHTDLSSTLE